ncbi:hypothetical protein EZV62_013572 [Acer yangbiense]|uniref:CTLH domain-containing protein n=1 Tax=Acer yangbiense TaxID=1000413 RepID=A0A5C7HZV5_9ROSI|nr:hypothetical protein EZV62_013572 [Acer yangbiense]
MSTSMPSRDLVFLILQFLEEEEKYTETIHKLEQESGLFFNVKYFEELVLAGKWDEVENYLSGFTKVEDNRHSMKLFFEIRKQKYFESLDRNERGQAVEILVNDLKVFAAHNEDLVSNLVFELVLMLFFRQIKENHMVFCRDNELLASYRDAESARKMVAKELKNLLESNPVFRDKLAFPNIKHSRLKQLMNQSLNWQHSLCVNPLPNPGAKTILVDHSCRNANDHYVQLAASNQHAGPAPRSDFLPIGAHGLPGPTQIPLKSLMSAPSILPHPSLSGGGIGFGTPQNPAFTHPAVSGGGIGFGTPPNHGIPTMVRGTGDSDNVSRTRMSGISDRMMLPGTSPSQIHNLAASTSTDELPKTVARTLNQESLPTSMDFHPILQTLLLVGTHVGEICLWEVSSGLKLASRNFHVWNERSSSMILKAALNKDPCVSVKRVLWSPDGSLFGIAYSKHMVQLYVYYGPSDIRHRLEIDAHVGSVNDLAFTNAASNQLFVITCGDDRTVKVWDVNTGTRLNTFEGHEAAVHSVFPHIKHSVNVRTLLDTFVPVIHRASCFLDTNVVSMLQFIFSTSVDGKIKAWLYDLIGSRLDYDAPDHACATLAYSADGKRLFSCGTNKEGVSHIVEWNEDEGSVKRAYKGFEKRSSGVVQLDTTKNKFLAAGDDHKIKFWDMDNNSLLTTIDAEGSLPVSPRIRFNKEGNLLAASANENKIIILATVDGLRLMRSSESHSLFASRRASDIMTRIGDSRNVEDVRSRLAEEVNNRRLTEINEPAQFRSLRLMSRVQTDKIARLVYTNSGTGILALALNAIHLLWRWPQSETNPNGKATTNVSPQLVQSVSGILMTNDLTNANPAESVPCFALSKNGSYVISASGGKVSLFNMMTFKTMTAFGSPPPAATYLAFHPVDNNIIAIGMDDSTIHIYNVRLDETKDKLNGHCNSICGLAFSHVLKTLVSAGADAEMILWSTDKWERMKSTALKFPSGKSIGAISNTQVQFHNNQTHFLAVNETQLAIYNAMKFECLNQWVVGGSSAPISHATFSGDSQLVYASFLDGALRIFTAPNLQLQRQINPSAYLQPGSPPMFPIAVAAHPLNPNQFAVGSTDGGVCVFEPLESDGQWGVPPSLQNRSAGRILPPPPAIAPDNPQG